MSTPTRFYGPALLPTAPATLFTGATDKRSLIEMISVMNESSSPVDLTLSIGINDAATRIYDAYTFGPNEMRAIPTYFVMEDGEVFQGFCGSASAIVLTVSGKVIDFAGDVTLGDYGHGTYNVGLYGQGN